MYTTKTITPTNNAHPNNPSQIFIISICAVNDPCRFAFGAIYPIVGYVVYNTSIFALFTTLVTKK